MKINWQFGKNFEIDKLSEDFLASPDDLLSSSGQLLKSSGYHRFVFQFGDNLIKVFEFSSLFEKLKWKRGFSAPQKEWKILKFMFEEGLSVPEPRALGYLECGKKIKVWLVTKYIEGCVTYDEMRPEWQREDAKERTEKLANLISGMHAAFVIHRDLHAGNLLWQPREKKWYITDFQHARRGFSTRVQLEEDLTQLQHCLGKKVPYRLRVVFLKAYIWNFAVATGTTETHSRRDWHMVWHEVAERLLSYDNDQARSRSRRALKKNRDFEPVIIWNNGQGYLKKGESSQLYKDLIALLGKREWHSDPLVTRFSRDKNASFAIYDHPQGRVVISNRETKINFLEKLFPAFRSERRFWRKVIRAILLHVPLERPLLVGRTDNSLTYVFFQKASFSLREAFQMIGFDKEKKAKLLRSLAVITARMHNSGMVHGALSCDCVCCAENGDLYIRDLQHSSFSSSVSWFGRVKDLASLLASAEGRLSYCEQRLFLRKYLANLVDTIDVRLLLSDVNYKASVIMSDENERR